ncbi:MAG: alpha-L-fucosidase [Saprospiraceae bacterium]|nr:alpha-L-fucosidase [Saprospiraceae bacterium]
MSRKLLSFVAFVVFLQSMLPAQTTYTPDWASLDTRPTPEWWVDAKFGIFIHWGVYAVPGFTKKGNYAEWYQHALENNSHEGLVRQYHERNYGDRTYYDLAQDFTADLFEPDEWAKLFEDAGAKYVVLTSKHHDGFCLWPNKHATRTWGMPWSSDKTGPRRDLVGDLFRALDKTSVKPGLYFSLYEWFNPLWQFDKERYAREHAMPQLYELIERYEPWVIWSDGDWDATPEQWKSPEFLAWLYNESAVKDKIVANDRWGSGVRFKHGGIYTPEYQPDMDFEDHAWEESRGMGHSYGFNRAEDAWDYNSTQSMILHLIDKVSRGGNFLLDVGPDEHGNIPPIMQDRLLEIGKWLKVNGEAIYNTRRWRTPSQWSEGRRDWKPELTEGWKTGGDALLKQTVDPDPGFAAKEVFFTWNPKTKAVYAMFPRWPNDRKITLKGLSLPATGSEATLLATKEKLKTENIGGNLVITLPEYNPNKIKVGHAWAIKLSGMSEFVAKPKIEVEYDPITVKPSVRISCPTSGTVIRYTIDGTPVKETSPTYSGLIFPDSACVVRTRAYKAGWMASHEMKLEVNSYNFKPALNLLRAPAPGLAMRATTVDGKYTTTSIQTGETQNTAIVSAIELEPICETKCGMIWSGYINLAQTGGYQFWLESDDGSLLYIDQEKIVDNDGDHGMEEKSGIAYLQKGWHSIRLLYYNAGGGFGLKVRYGRLGEGKKEFLSNQFGH